VPEPSWSQPGASGYRWLVHTLGQNVRVAGRRRAYARRAGVTAVSAVLASGLMTGLGAASAWAAVPESWTDHEPMPFLHALGLFVGVPVAIIALVVVLATAGRRSGGADYRPGVSWWAEPEWFAGPAADSVGAPTPAPSLPRGAGVGAGTREGGGAGARW